LIKSRTVAKLVFAVILLLTFSPVTGCTLNHDFDKDLKRITKPYRFSVVKWELNAFGEGIRETLCDRQKTIDDKISKVTEYFSAVEEIKRLESEIESVKAGNRQGDMDSLEAELNRLQQQNSEVADTVENILETQIKEALSQQGIFNPITGSKAVLPPVNFKLERPPHMLVVSPRDRIESMKKVALLQDMSPEDMEIIEGRVDELDVSSLVVRLGGYSTYPSFVTDKAGLRFVIETAVHEWLHQYLVFKPLGFRYMLDTTGVCRDYEVATMNETLVGMVSEEIGAIVYENNYAREEANNARPETTESGFDFNQEMREIRRAVDEYLAQGEIEQAEEFMEQKRQFLATRGYHIRKLNQAYFAFYGTYADSPTSISPIGVEMKKLRDQSASLKEFLETAASMSSRRDLAESIN